ncbi:hypothetical protein lbkm_0630 [Lachnospiraceae bacterium KM106-2]|nr:hypothetical protein lbkm_0630 [Lachnospiraceae bacterium KM106-2]
MELTVQELLSIKKIMLETYQEEAKYKSYMEDTKEPYLKEIFLKLSNQAIQNRQLLLQFLN